MKSLQELFAKVGVTAVGSFIVPTGNRTAITFSDNMETATDRSPEAVVSNLLAGAIESVRAPMFEVNGNTVFPLAPNVAEMLDFSQALAAMKSGYPLARATWSDKKQYIRLGLVANAVSKGPAVFEILVVNFGNTPQRGMWSPWKTTTEDIIANDWEILTDSYLLAEAKKQPPPPPPPQEDVS